MSVVTELEAQKRVTAAFIAANPVSLALVPTTQVRTGSGGTRRQSEPSRPIQVLRLIQQNTQTGNVPGPLRSGDGTSRKSTFQLLGRWDASMAVGDTWIDPAGQRLEVVEMLPFNGYEVRGRVEKSG